MATFTEWTDDLEDALAEPFPPECIGSLNKGGASIPFVAWHHYARRLNHLVGPGWSMGEPILREVAGKLITAIPVTIFGVTRVNFGDEDEGKDDYGTAATNSWAQAFKRTCALFGMGLDMYEKKGARPQQRSGQPTAQRTSNGTSRPASEKQLTLMKRLAASSKFDNDQNVIALRAGLEEGAAYSSKLASKWIDFLQGTVKA